MTDPTQENRPDRLVEALRWAYGQAVAAIDEADPDVAFAAATKLTHLIAEFYKQTPQVRGRQAHRVWKANELSLQQLGDRIGVSKARADQLVKLAQLIQ